MTRVLMVGCPREIEDLLPPNTDATTENHRLPPQLIVVGPLQTSPLVSAQHISERHPGAPLLIIVSADALESTREQLRMAPFVPAGTVVVSALDRPQLERTLAASISRSLLLQRHRDAQEQATSRKSRSASGRPILPAESPEVMTSGEDDDAFRALLATFEQHHELLFTPNRRDHDFIRDVWDIAMLRSAIVDGEWAQWLAQLTTIGHHLDHLAMSDWLHALVTFRDNAVAHFGQDQLAQLGLMRLVDLATATIGDAYMDARAQIADEHEDRQRIFSTIVETSSDAMLTKTLRGVVTAWNPACERTYGFTEAEALGQNIVDLIVPTDKREEFEDILRTLADGQPIEDLETIRVGKAGRRIPVSLSLTPVASRSGEIIGASVIARDISERQRRQAHHAAMLTGALDAVITMDHQGTVLEFNDAAERIFGHPRGEVIGKQLADTIIPTAQRDAHRAGVKRVVATGQSQVLGRRLEVTARHSSGREFPVELSIIQLAETDPPLFTGFVRDISSLKIAEAKLQQLVANLERSNRDLDQFAAVASHDLQEPLRMVASYTELLARRYQGQLDEQADKYIAFAVDGARRMQRLVTDLLSVAKVTDRSQQFAPVPLGEVWRDVLEALHRRIGDTEAVVTADDLPTVMGDRTQLGQVFQNLLSNALKFVRDTHPVVVVKVAQEENEWVISMADNGIGFDQDEASRIFVMFRRLHASATYDGTGIGLALVKRIVEQHHGRCWAESEPNRGSRFFVTFPVALPPAEP